MYKLYSVNANNWQPYSNIFLQIFWRLFALRSHQTKIIHHSCLRWRNTPLKFLFSKDNTKKRVQSSITRAGFETAIPHFARPVQRPLPDHSPPSSAIVTDEWSYTSTPQYVFMACCLIKHRGIYTFYYPQKKVNLYFWSPAQCQHSR
jgi:hypothetical protein